MRAIIFFLALTALFQKSYASGHAAAKVAAEEPSSSGSSARPALAAAAVAPASTASSSGAAAATVRTPAQRDIDAVAQFAKLVGDHASTATTPIITVLYDSVLRSPRIALIQNSKSHCALNVAEGKIKAGLIALSPFAADETSALETPEGLRALLDFIDRGDHHQLLPPIVKSIPAEVLQKVYGATADDFFERNLKHFDAKPDLASVYCALYFKMTDESALSTYSSLCDVALAVIPGGQGVEKKVHDLVMHVMGDSLRTRYTAMMSAYIARLNLCRPRAVSTGTIVSSGSTPPAGTSEAAAAASASGAIH